ncbi:MAG: DUF1343 domain-containing protein [Bacteroidia bacterium]|nr:DUF1343 domain-containing protein [Bacteroidia bacterium]
MKHLIFCSLLISVFNSAFSQSSVQNQIIFHESLKQQTVITGAEQTGKYFPLIEGKTIAVVCNQTSIIGQSHLIDTLLAMGMKLKCVFAPEHGFRGEAGAGETIKDAKDKRTGLPVVSLYGNKKKPTAQDLAGVQTVIFDIQDVGARFYTYISTMTYVMEACAEHKIQLLILDRPNPNGHYVDGPVLKKGFESFVGLHPVPIVHGMTVGEYAHMLNGEGWLSNKLQCNLKVITCRNYDHQTEYNLPVRPSPNLPNMSSIYLYPSLCLFEGTPLSIGRGTEFPFQVVGFPGFKDGDLEFTPVTIDGVVKNPPYENRKCKGIDLRAFGEEYMKNFRGIYLYWLTGLYEAFPDKEKFFTPFFNKLAGTDELMKQIKNKMPEEDIRQSWQKELSQFKKIRSKYLLYDDFE